MQRRLVHWRFFPLLILLLGNFLLRLAHFDYPVINGEAQRDYIVGRHIVTYGEILLTGPCCLWNGAFGHIRNSPAYYYFIAAILKLREDILFLGFVNILLQISTIGMVYLLAERLFGKRTGLIAALLFGLSQEVFRQSRFFWQPHAMHPFVVASYLLMLLAWQRRNLSFLLLSLFSFLFAAALHNPPYGLLPTFGLVALVVLKQQKNVIKAFIAAIAVSVATVASLYAPWLMYTMKNPPTLMRGHTATFDAVSFFTRLSVNVQTLLTAFSLRSVVGIFVFILVVLYIKRQNDRKRKMFFCILLAAIGQFLFVASLFPAKMWSYYLTPVLSLFAIVVAESLQSVRQDHFFEKAFLVVCVVFLLKAFSFDFSSFRNFHMLQEARRIEEATSKVVSEIASLAIERQFWIRAYAPGVESPVTGDLVLWAPLEKKLNSRFIKVIDGGNSYEFLNSDTYTFVICQSHLSRIRVDRECLNPFFRESKTHVLLKNIYTREPFTIFLTKRQ